MTSPASEAEQPQIAASKAAPGSLSDWRVSTFILAALWFVIYIVGLSTPALLDDADTVHAEAAREMVLRHDWVTLKIDNGIRYLEKAPLMYWCVASSYKLFGVSEWSTRFPLMLFVLAMILATYGVGKWAYGPLGGFHSGLVMATAIGPYLFTRFLIPDVLVGFWLTLTFWLFLKSLEESPPSRGTCWGLAAVCALNVLTKGLIGLVFPAGAIGLFLILTRNLKHLLKLRPISSLLVFFAIGAPWHILAAIRNPAQGQVRGFLWFYFVNEHILRFLNKRVPRDYDTVPLLIFWALLIVWLIPWSAFVPQGLLEVPHRWRELRGQLSRRQRANLLFILWSLVIVGFFSFSTRQEYYTIPAIPGMALLIGGWLAREQTSAPDSIDRRAGRLSSIVLFAFGLLISVICLGLFFFSKMPPAGTDLSQLLKRNPGDYALSFGHFLDLTPQAMGMFRVPLLIFSLAFLFGPLANWLFRRKGRPGAGNVVLAAMMVAVLFCVHSGFTIFNPILSSKDLALAIQRHYRPGDQIVVADEYESASTLNFYTGLPLRVLHMPSGNLWYGSRFPDAPHVFETQQSFLALWNGEQRVFLWSDKEPPAELHGLTSYVVASRGGKAIYTNRPLIVQP